MFNREVFFRLARLQLFGGVLRQPQVDGMNAILDAWEKRLPNMDLRWLAYMLATVLWETAHTMMPVREAYWYSEDWRRKNLRYYPFYGRGLVQLTWEQNYRKMGLLLGIDLVNNPDLALDLENSIEIMFEGMLKANSNIGDFTGKSLEMYFLGSREDWVGARRIINGTDKAEEIADVGRTFFTVLKEALKPANRLDLKLT